MKHYSLSYTFILFLTILCTKTTLQGSEITSLGTFSKDDKKIYVIGAYPNKKVDSLAPFFSELYKEVIQSLSKSSISTAFVINFSKLAICKGYYIPDPTNLDSFAIDEAAHNNFKKGALDFIAFDYEHNMLVENIRQSFPYYINPERLYLIGNEAHISQPYLLDISIFLNNNYAEKDPFSSNPKLFKQLATALTNHSQKKSDHPTIQEYLEVINYYVNKLNDSEETDFICSLKKELKHKTTQLSLYLKAHNSSPKDDKLITIFLKEIAKKKSFLKACAEFQVMTLTPLDLILQLERYFLLFKLLNHYNKIIFYLFPSSAKEFSKNLVAQGFAEKMVGWVPQEATMAKISYLDYDKMEKQLMAIAEDSFGLQKTTSLSQSKVSYFNEDSNSFEKNSNKDLTEAQCIQCKSSIQRYKAFSAAQDSTIHCSLECLMQTLFAQEKNATKLSVLLNKDHTLSDEEKMVLQQFGALCYLEAVLLMPSLVSEHGIIYQLPLATLIKQLQAFISCSEDAQPSTLKKVKELCSTWHLDLKNMALSLTLYKRCKDEYLQALLKDRTKRMEEGTTGVDSFDENTSLPKLQKNWFALVKKSFQFSESCHTNSVLFLFLELVDRIHKRVYERVHIPFNTITSILTLDYKLTDINNLLASLGYEENPFKQAAKGYQPHYNYDFSANNESSEEIETLSVEEPSLEPQLITSLISTSTEPFKPASLKKWKMRTIHDLFGQVKPYTITLFKARKYAASELQDAYTLWKSYGKTKDAYRVKILFALAEQALEKGCSFIKNNYNYPTIQSSEELDEDTQQKLDIHHLFSRKVDTFLKTYGIAEQIGDLLQITIPGEIKYDDTHEVGFFQYSFNPQKVLIHRCFKPYKANTTDNYISTLLKQILYDFLVTECSSEAYGTIKEALGAELKL